MATASSSATNRRTGTVRDGCDLGCPGPRCVTWSPSATSRWLSSNPAVSCTSTPSSAWTARPTRARGRLPAAGPLSSPSPCSARPSTTRRRLRRLPLKNWLRSRQHDTSRGMGHVEAKVPKGRFIRDADESDCPPGEFGAAEADCPPENVALPTGTQCRARKPDSWSSSSMAKDRLLTKSAHGWTIDHYRPKGGVRWPGISLEATSRPARVS